MTYLLFWRQIDSQQYNRQMIELQEIQLKKEKTDKITVIKFENNWKFYPLILDNFFKV